MSYRPSTVEGGSKGSSSDFQGYANRESYGEFPPREVRELANREAFGEPTPRDNFQSSSRRSPRPDETRGTGTISYSTSYSTSYNTGSYSSSYTSSYISSSRSGLATSRSYRDTAESLRKEVDQVKRDFDRLKAESERYERKKGKLRDYPEFSELYYKTDSRVSREWDEVKGHHGEIARRVAEFNRTYPKHAEEARAKKPERSYTDDYPSKPSRSESYGDPPRSFPREEKPKRSNSNSYQDEPKNGSRHGKTPTRSNSNSYQDESKSGSWREEKPRSGRNSTYDENRRKERTRRASPPPPIEEELPNYYATLGISPKASSAEIAKAAKMKRIEVHPDKCKKAGMSERELKDIDKKAALVGQAADVLTNPKLKADYYLEFRMARLAF